MWWGIWKLSKSFFHFFVLKISRWSRKAILRAQELTENRGDLYIKSDLRVQGCLRVLGSLTVKGDVSLGKGSNLIVNGEKNISGSERDE